MQREAGQFRGYRIQPPFDDGQCTGDDDRGVTTAPPRADAVRVVKVANEGTSWFAFAACTTEERLVGGSCIIEEDVVSTVEGYPSEHSATDTIGARWNCGKKTPYKRRLIAYALCQRVASP